MKTLQRRSNLSRFISVLDSLHLSPGQFSFSKTKILSFFFKLTEIYLRDLCNFWLHFVSFCRIYLITHMTSGWCENSQVGSSAQSHLLWVWRHFLFRVSVSCLMRVKTILTDRAQLVNQSGKRYQTCWGNLFFKFPVCTFTHSNRER